MRKNNRTIMVAVIVTVFVLSIATITTFGFGSSAHEQEKAQKKEAVLWAAEDIKWTEIPNSGGEMIAPLWGDMSKGAYGVLLKEPAGLKAALHTHTHDLRIVVISGTFLYAPESGPEKKFGPGSYLFIPGGEKHMSGFATDAPCIFFEESAGAFDSKPVGGSAPEKK